MSRTVGSALTFVIGCVFFVGLPVLAWGVTDVQGLFAHPARLTFFALVCVLNALAAIRVPEVGKPRAKEKTRIRRQHLAVILLQILSMLLVLVAPYCDRWSVAVMGEQSSARYVGLLLYAAGFLTMHVAEAHLGRQFSVEVSIQPGHRLVTDGPYRYLRHPRYSGIMLFAAGIALVFRSWLGLAIALAIGLVLIWRILDEEALMHREFTTEWETYVKRTRRLIPFVF